MGKQPAEMKSIILETFGQTAALVDSKVAGDAAGFKSWLRQISARVADASKEGRFLGFGGVQVSDAEKATLVEVSKALKLAA
jgi:hypothetical protein